MRGRRVASRAMVLHCALAPVIWMFCRIRLCDFRPSSTRQTWAAPRDRASRPSAPVPAKRSSTRASLIGSPNLPPIRTLNRLSRTRSVVGRKCAPASPLPTDANAFPRKSPAMILMLSTTPLNWCLGWRSHPGLVIFRPLSDACQSCSRVQRSSHQPPTKFRPDNTKTTQTHRRRHG